MEKSVDPSAIATDALPLPQEPLPFVNYSCRINSNIYFCICNTCDNITSASIIGSISLSISVSLLLHWHYVVSILLQLSLLIATN